MSFFLTFVLVDIPGTERRHEGENRDERLAQVRRDGNLQLYHKASRSFQGKFEKRERIDRKNEGEILSDSRDERQNGSGR